MVIIHPLHVALLKLIIIHPILVIVHHMVWTIVYLALKLDLVGVEVIWLRRLRDVLEGTEGDAVVIVLVSDIDEGVVLRRGIQHLLVMILLILVAVEDGLVYSLLALLLFMIFQAWHVLPAVSSEPFLVLFVGILLIVKLLVVSIRVDHLINILVKLWGMLWGLLKGLIALVGNHATELRGQLNLLLSLQVELWGNPVYLLVPESELLG